MKPTTRVVFEWLDRRNKRQELVTTFAYFKQYAIELAEDEQVDIVRDVYYTINNVTKRLDYYNEELLS